MNNSRNTDKLPDTNLQNQRWMEDQDYNERANKDEQKFLALQDSYYVERMKVRKEKLARISSVVWDRFVTVAAVLVIFAMLCSGTWIGPLAAWLRTAGVI